MQITHLKLTNWKNFKSVDVDVARRLFLIGPNASGKSNFLDVFRFLKDISTSGLRSAVASRGGVSAIRSLSAGRVNRIGIDVTLLGDAENKWRYKLEFLQDNNQNPVVQEESVWHNGRQILSRPDNDDDVDKERLTRTAIEQIIANQQFRQISQFFLTVTYLHLIPQAVRDPTGFASGPVKDDPFGRDFLIRVMQTNKKTSGSRLTKIAAALKAAVPQLESLEIQQDEKTGRPHLVATYENWRAQGATQLENQFSDGTLRLLGLLWSIFEGSGPLLLEEPELSLHSEVVRLLPQLFERGNRARKEARQIFVSTHSTELLDDKGIAAEEILRLSPTDHGTVIFTACNDDKKAMKGGLTAADVLLPLSRPKNINQLVFSF
jgi:predicted ATPase